MSGEISSVDFDRFDQCFGKLPEPIKALDPRFHSAIYSQGNENWRFTKNAVPETTPSELVQRTQKVAEKYGAGVSPMGAGGSIETGARLEWGGKDGAQFSGYLKGEAHDDKGNSAQVTIEQNSEGKGNVSASTKYSKDSDDK